MQSAVAELGRECFSCERLPTAVCDPSAASSLTAQFRSIIVAADVVSTVVVRLTVDARLKLCHTTLVMVICRKCEHYNVSAKVAAAKANGFCRKCWGEDGYRDENGNLPQRCQTPLDENGRRPEYCTVWVRTRGASAAMQLCKKCFAVAEQKTWLDVCEGEWAYISDWLHLYEPNTVFIGNLPYTMEEDDVRNWVQQVMEHMPRCSIRCRRSGHWVHGKIFKRFAFLEFYVVEDAYRTLQAVDGKLCTFSGHSRHIVAYPAVKCERIVYSKKWVFHWMKGCRIGEWVLDCRPRLRSWHVLRGCEGDCHYFAVATAM